MAVIFLLLTIFSRTKFSVVYAAFGAVFWFALAGLNLAVFETAPSLHTLSWLWAAVGIVVFLIGLALSLAALKVDSQNKEMEID